MNTDETQQGGTADAGIAGSHDAQAAAHQPHKVHWTLPLGILSIAFSLLVITVSIKSLSDYRQMHLTTAGTTLSVFDPFGPQSRLNAKADVVSLPVYILLAVAGIMLIRRHPRSILLHRCFAITGSLVAIAKLVVAVSLCLALTAYQRRNLFEDVNIYSAITKVGVWTIGLWVVYPAFCLFWFLKKSVQNQGRAWSAE